MGELVLSLKYKWLRFFAVSIVAICLVQTAHADEKVSAYELLYDEQETGTDVYAVRFTVTDRYIRIDDLSDDSGYILYDDKEKKIYSVSHYDESVFVIPAYKYKKPDMRGKVKELYEPLTNAPKISGKTVYNYRVNSVSDSKDVCVDIQLVPDLLPDVTKIMQKYQKVVTGQQAKSLKSTPEEYQTTCFIYNQVFNDGEYYAKGLPVLEWHSNGKKRILTSYKKKDVDSAIFDHSEAYREYSLD